MKRIVLLGSTGSIGQNVLDVVDKHRDDFELVGLGANRSVATLAAQCRAHPGARVAVTDAAAREELCRIDEVAPRCVGGGDAALIELIEETRPDLVVNALVGFVGLRPTMAALSAGVPVAIANKESIVTGGEVLQSAARAAGAALIPVDSEHVAIAQCLKGERLEDVDRVIFTASGGALRDRELKDFPNVTVADVLAHPTWDMGAKITVDCATLVNKGLEIIEGHWLFGLPYDRVEVVIHPQSVVHSMVRYVDGSIMAQMGRPDMRLPILYALSYPDRVSSPLRDEAIDLPDLSFAALDPVRYPCFDLVMGAARAGGNAPTVLNAANEVAVAAFLDGRAAFTDIPAWIDAALGAVETRPVRELEDIYEADAATRRWLTEAFPAARSSSDSLNK